MASPDDTSTIVQKRDYTRRESVQLEVDRLPLPHSPQFVEAVVAMEQPETLIFGIRSLYRLGLDQECLPLWDRLVTLLQGPMARQARKWDDALYDDLIQHTTIDLWKRITDLSDTQLFLEYNTLQVVKLSVSNTAKALLRQRGEYKREAGQMPVSLDQLVDEGSFHDGIPSHGQSVEDMVLDSLTVKEMVNELPEEVARAVLLFQAGFKIGSKDPEEPSISQLLGVTPRTVQNYLQRARDILRPVHLMKQES